MSITTKELDKVREKLSENIEGLKIAKRRIADTSGKVSYASVKRALDVKSGKTTVKTLNHIIEAYNELCPPARRMALLTIQDSTRRSLTSVDLPQSSRLELDWLTAHGISQSAIFAMAPMLYAVLGKVCIDWAEEKAHPTGEAANCIDVIDDANEWRSLREELGGFTLFSILQETDVVSVAYPTVFECFLKDFFRDLKWRNKFGKLSTTNPSIRSRLVPNVGFFEDAIVEALDDSTDAYDALLAGISAASLKDALNEPEGKRAKLILSKISETSTASSGPWRRKYREDQLNAILRLSKERQAEGKVRPFKKGSVA